MTGVLAQAAPGAESFFEDASQQDCPTVDLVEKSLQRTPRHQGESNFCYAVVTADLLSAELNINVSAADVALKAVASDTGFLNGGLVRTAVESLSSAGACSEENASQALKSLGEKSDVPVLQVLFEKLSQRKKLDPGVAEFIRSEGLLECRNPISVADLEVVEFSAHDYIPFSSSYRRQQEMVLDRVDELLDNGKIQAVSYYSDDCVFCTPGFHVVSLVGRYLNPKTRECTYVLRNSYGVYDESPNFFGVFAKEGYIHMPREEALREFVRVQYIK